MALFVEFIVLIQLLFFLFCAGALIFLIIRRIKQKEEEDFEQRDN